MRGHGSTWDDLRENGTKHPEEMGTRGSGDLPMLHPKALETPRKALEVSLFTSECQACCGFSHDFNENTVCYSVLLGNV